MSKIVILLLFVLAASAVDAVRRRDRLRTLQMRLESYFGNEIYKVETKYNTIQTIIRQKSGILRNVDINSMYARAYYDVYAILSKVREETREPNIETLGTKNCRKMISSLDARAKDFLLYVYMCTDNILIEANERISDMESKYERLHSGLIDRQKNFAACLRKIHTNAELNTNIEVDEANRCMANIEEESTRFVTEGVPHVFANIDETYGFLSGAVNPIYLATCLNGYAGFQMEAANLTRRVKECYQQEMNEGAVRRVPNKVATDFRKSI